MIGRNALELVPSGRRLIVGNSGFGNFEGKVVFCHAIEGAFCDFRRIYSIANDGIDAGASGKGSFIYRYEFIVKNQFFDSCIFKCLGRDGYQPLRELQRAGDRATVKGSFSDIDKRVG